jgi:zinc D-Ala-D-Ala carboxypeptidase
MQLSPHFTLAEFTVSETAARKGIDNEPGEAAIENLKRLAARLEQVRFLFGAPVIITSGYRSPPLNEAVGGAKNSAHMWGYAADFIIPSMGSPLHVATRINNRKDIVFDQLINEYDSWVHFAIEPEDVDARRETLTYKRGGGIFPFLC